MVVTIQGTTMFQQNKVYLYVKKLQKVDYDKTMDMK